MTRADLIAEINDLLPPLQPDALVRGLPLTDGNGRTCIVKCRHSRGGWRDDTGRHLTAPILDGLVVDVTEPLGYAFAAVSYGDDLPVSGVDWVLDALDGLAVGDGALSALLEVLADASESSST